LSRGALIAGILFAITGCASSTTETGSGPATDDGNRLETAAGPQTAADLLAIINANLPRDVTVAMATEEQIQVAVYLAARQSIPSRPRVVADLVAVMASVDPTASRSIYEAAQSAVADAEAANEVSATVVAEISTVVAAVIEEVAPASAFASPPSPVARVATPVEKTASRISRQLSYWLLRSESKKWPNDVGSSVVSLFLDGPTEEIRKAAEAFVPAGKKQDLSQLRPARSAAKPDGIPLEVLDAVYGAVKSARKKETRDLLDAMGGVPRKYQQPSFPCLSAYYLCLADGHEQATCFTVLCHCLGQAMASPNRD